MTKGIANVEYVRQGSEVAVQGVPNWAFLYFVSTQKHAKYNIGDRVVLPDGRAFRYALAGGTLNPAFGACVPDASITNAFAPAQIMPTTPNILGVKLSAGQVGDYVVTIAVGASDGILGTGAIAADEMRGGTIVINNGLNQEPQTRGILGNDAILATATDRRMNVYLDGPINNIIIAGVTYSGVVVGTTNIEAYMNEFGNVKSMYVVNSAYVSMIGAPAAHAVAGQYVWIQTWGKVWMTSNSVTGEAANGRDLYVATDGSLRGQSSTTYAGTQRVGFGLDKSAAGTSNGPNCYLQLMS
jgi:hypothetical protein